MSAVVVEIVAHVEEPVDQLLAGVDKAHVNRELEAADVLPGVSVVDRDGSDGGDEGVPRERKKLSKIAAKDHLR